jgi:hypothetical protein
MTTSRSVTSFGVHLRRASPSVKNPTSEPSIVSTRMVGPMRPISAMTAALCAAVRYVFPRLSLSSAILDLAIRPSLSTTRLSAPVPLTWAATAGSTSSSRK